MLFFYFIVVSFVAIAVFLSVHIILLLLATDSRYFRSSLSGFVLLALNISQFVARVSQN